MGDIQAGNTTPASPLTTFIESQGLSDSVVGLSDHRSLALQVQYDLQYQHDWTSIQIHEHSTASFLDADLLPRPLISGLPARHVYIYPDDQLDMLKHGFGEKDVPVEREWVLPTHLREKWTLRRFAEVFDAVDATPPGEQAQTKGVDGRATYHRVKTRGKRLLMAVVNDDSTIVYYIIHDGIVKPRQN